MKVCVGLSGGVDSSVAALLLKRQGYDVFAMFMQNWHDTEGTLHGDCEWEEDKFVAEMVARKIGIPFYFVDLSDEYRKRVVDYMFDEYSKGRTPNPDVLCNREIKFDAFLNAARKLGADMVATGHYCRRRENPDGSFSLLEGVDPGKDQSYFLCQLSQQQLSKAMFPIGDMLKSEVRALAKEADLPSADKKDSQGICFVGKVDLPIFLQQKLKPREGNVVEVFDAYYDNCELYQAQKALIQSLALDGEQVPMVSTFVSEDKPGDAGECRLDPLKLCALSSSQLRMLSAPMDYSDIVFETETYRSGKKHIKKTRFKPNPYGCIAGTHDGAQFYTIGQRKGLSIGGHKDPVFVIGTDIASNTIYVGERHTHPGLSRYCIALGRDIHFIRPGIVLRPGHCERVRVRIRYRQPLQDATLLEREDGAYVFFDFPQRGITAGQFAAIYAADGTECPELIGSAVI
ncbi:MAG: tRNA 2-thiouridine(34) synthase MnmA [Bacteroidales bacterium]|nr:tRNA 2-thiouridine(34) synthase MnmA [Bacteroidales bacterium]